MVSSGHCLVPRSSSLNWWMRGICSLLLRSVSVGRRKLLASYRKKRLILLVYQLILQSFPVCLLSLSLLGSLRPVRQQWAHTPPDTTDSLQGPHGHQDWLSSLRQPLGRDWVSGGCSGVLVWYGRSWKVCVWWDECIVGVAMCYGVGLLLWKHW